MKPLTATNDGDGEMREKQREILKQIEKEMLDNVDSGPTKVVTVSPEKFKNFVSVSLNANDDDENSRCNQQNSMVWKAFNERYGFNRYCMWLIMALIGLCCVGMCASIGGAIYIRYFRHSPVKALSMANITSAAGNKRLSSAPTVPSQTSLRPEIFRVNIKINSAEEKASTNYADSFPTISSTMDPFEETLYKEMFKRPNIGDLDMHMHSGSSIDSEFAAVNNDGDLQKEPAIADLITFVKRLLNIPDLSVQTTTDKIV